MSSLLWSSHLVAHRGESADFPENTVVAMQSALQAGANYLECDIQLSRDGQAMVIHDSRMGRTTTINQGRVWDYSAQQLQRTSAGYADRFADKFADITIPTLNELVELLQQWPLAHIFVELKRASLSQFGVSSMLNAVLPCLTPIAGRYTLISYDFDALRHVKEEFQLSLGWVSDTIDSEVIARAKQLMPEYLITDAEGLDAKYVSANHQWRWMLFEVNQPTSALSWLDAGVEFIETNRVKNYLSPPP